MLIVLCIPLLGDIKDYRSQMKSPPNKVFEGMLGSIKQNNLSGVKEISELCLGPLYQEVQNTFNVDLSGCLSRAVESNDNDQTLVSVQRIILYDMKALFELAGKESDKARAVGLLKTAYLDYNLLSPAIQAKDFKKDQMIRKTFQDCYYSAGSDSPYGQDHEEGKGGGLAELTNKIEGMILEVMPELTAPKEIPPPSG